MKVIVARRITGALSIGILLFAGACATTLAPRYDQVIVDGLTSVNVKLMEHFASVSAGTIKEDYVDRKKTYNNLIGSLEALTIQAKARPMPQNKIIDKVNEFLQKRGVAVLDDGEAPSATALEKITETIVKMRDTDIKQGVTPIEVKVFKSQVAIYLDQAITYENFLKR